MHTRFAKLWPQGQAPLAPLCAEDERLGVLAAHGTGALLDDPELQRIVDFAAKLCAAPIALVTMVEREQQTFLARSGLEARSTPRPTSFCAHAMLGRTPMVVPDALLDARFAGNALVVGAPHIRFYAGHPLVSVEGAPLGALCIIDTVPRETGLSQLQREGLAVLADAVMRRLSQQRLGDAATASVEAREAQLRRMIDSVPGIAFSATAEGEFDYFNAQWSKVTGSDAPRLASEWAPYVHPEDYPASLDRWTASVASLKPYEDRWRLKQADGSWRWTLSRVVPVVAEGGATRWFGSLVDIDEAHREAEARELISNELSHRIKNIFAVVSGLVALRARGRPEVGEFAGDLGSAIRALGTAHDYVRPDSGRRSDSLASLLQDLLAPYDSAGGQRFEVSGDPIAIGSRAATPLALIFHELATNSAKYGALAQDDGKVTVRITAPCENAQQVCVDWREEAPGRHADAAMGEEGFGSRLLRMAIESQLGGRFERRIAEDGLEVHIEIPADRITQ